MCEPPSLFKYTFTFLFYNPDPDIAKRNLLAAMCVRRSSARHVLQFAPINVACYVLHRSVSRVIHGNELFFYFILVLYLVTELSICLGFPICMKINIYTHTHTHSTNQGEQVLELVHYTPVNEKGGFLYLSRRYIPTTSTGIVYTTMSTIF